MKHEVFNHENSNKCWVNALLFSFPLYLQMLSKYTSLLFSPLSPLAPLDVLPHLIPHMAFLAKFTFGHHLPLITVPLWRNIFSSCKLNCPSGATSHLMKTTAWHRPGGSLYDSFGILSLFKLWTHFAALRIRISLMC